MPPTSLAQRIPASATFAPSLLSTRQRSVRRRSEMITCFRLAGGAVMPRDTAIAAEVPVALVYNGVSHVVMMATPSDLADFAVGFSVSEGILADRAELLDLEIEEGKTGIRVSMTITEERFAGLKARRRNMTGRTGCGLCGVDDLTQVARPLPRVGTGVTVDVGAIHRALDALPARQPANTETGAVHAAAWATPTGEIALVREDVGQPQRARQADRWPGVLSNRARSRVRRDYQPLQFRDGAKGRDDPNSHSCRDLGADDKGAARRRTDRNNARRVGAVGQHHCLHKSRKDKRVGNGALGLQRRSGWSG